MLKKLNRKGARKTRISLADRARDSGEWVVAAHYYREALDRNPSNPPIWVQYGHVLKQSGHVSEAESAYRQALELAPDAADTHLQLGHALKIQGRKDEAAASYLRALALDPKLPHASAELRALGWKMLGIDDKVRRSMRSALRQLTTGKDNQETERDRTPNSIVFDIGDLVKYFVNSRVPSGIQRVQLNVITSLILRRNGLKCNLVIACCNFDRDRWVRVPGRLFLELANLAVAGGQPGDPGWRAATSELRYLLAIGKSLEFQRNAVLVNLGTSWWLPNYFLMVRAAKAKSGIRYIPFVHDCIPVMLPEHCDKQTARDYINWLTGVFFHADGYLTNSSSTAADLKEFAGRLGHEIAAPHVVRLDGYLAAAPGGDEPTQSSDRHDVISRHELHREEFVLFVSTLESRKNHTMAFNAWLALIKKRGLQRTPLLVCVGKLDPTGKVAVERLHASELLERKVLLLSQITDDDLAELYRQCLFTLYPSLYEGWGLPITEALSHGKIPLTTTVSSLAEAGGDLAEYFDVLSLRDLIEKLERLIDDNDYRKAKEARIRECFKARSWMDIGAEIVETVLADYNPPIGVANCERTKNSEIWPMRAETGRYYPITHNDESSIWPGKIAGEMYRMGSGWWPAEEWGTWARSTSADLAFSLNDAARAIYLIYIGLRAPPMLTKYRVDIVGSGIGVDGTLTAGEDHWTMLQIKLSPVQAVVHLRLTADGLYTIMRDGITRAVSVGVLGFYVCRKDNLPERDRFTRALQLKHLNALLLPQESITANDIVRR
jgi:glycosyltransferase involved in cell wall biosynthesis